MLVLARRLDESIQIGDNIKITVVELQNGKVRLGIDAPPDVQIVRSELLTRMKKFELNAQREPIGQSAPVNNVAPKCD